MTALKSLLKGKKIIPQIVYGIVDALPFPNLLNPVRSAIKHNPDATLGQVAVLVARKTDPLRLAVALIFSYLIVSGKMTYQTLAGVVDLAERLAKLF